MVRPFASYTSLPHVNDHAIYAVVSDRHGHQPGGPTLKDQSGTNASPAIPFWIPTNHWCGSYNQRTTYLPIAGFGNLGKAGLPADGVLSLHHQIRPGSEMSCAFKGTDLSGARRNPGR